MESMIIFLVTIKIKKREQFEMELTNILIFTEDDSDVDC